MSDEELTLEEKQQLTAWIDAWKAEPFQSDQDGNTWFTVTIPRVPWADPEDTEVADETRLIYSTPMPWVVWLLGPESFKKQSIRKILIAVFDEVVLPHMEKDTSGEG